MAAVVAVRSRAEIEGLGKGVHICRSDSAAARRWEGSQFTRSRPISSGLAGGGPAGLIGQARSSVRRRHEGDAGCLVDGRARRRCSRFRSRRWNCCRGASSDGSAWTAATFTDSSQKPSRRAQAPGTEGKIARTAAPSTAARRCPRCAQGSGESRKWSKSGPLPWKDRQMYELPSGKKRNCHVGLSSAAL